MKEKIRMVSFLLLIATISAGLLGLLNVATEKRIEQNKVQKLREKVLEALNISYESGKLVEIYNNKVERESVADKTIYIARDEEGNIEAVAFEIVGGGFQGPISAIIALKPGLTTIHGLAILDQEETPGLGGRITEEWFSEQFKNKKIAPKIELVSLSSSTDKNEVNAITGATRTSEAVRDIINSDVLNFRPKLADFNGLGGSKNE